MGARYQNNREFHRIKFKNKVNLHFSQNNYPHCQIEDLSLTGMLVRGHFTVKQDDQCQIYFFHTEKLETKVFRASSKVIRCNKKEVALKFISMPLDSYKSLVTLLMNNTELPEVIMYEFSKICPFEVHRA